MRVFFLNGSQPDGEDKFRAFSELRFDPYLPAHHFDDAFGYGKAQACTAEFLRNIGISLAEYLKKLLSLFRGYPYAGISNIHF